MRDRRSLTPSEKALWQHYVKDLKPLPKRRADGDSAQDQAGMSRKSPLTQRVSGVRTSPRAATIGHVAQSPAKPADIDRNARRKLKRGRTAVDARLDLHGYKAVQAQHRLIRFVEESRSRGCRCVLVITGKGTNSSDGMFNSGGTLRRLVPEWLRQAPLNQHVVSMGTAERRHGGGGAYYVFLRAKGK